MEMKTAKLLILPVLIFLTAGCTGYRTGSTLPESVQTVSLKVLNETDEPSIEVEVMKALRAELQMDGRLEVLSEDKDVDSVLRVTLTSYYLTPLAYDKERGTLAREYRMSLNGRAVLFDAESGDVIMETPGLRGWADFPYVADLTTAKLGALPKAAGDLARKVVSMTVMSW